MKLGDVKPKVGRERVDLEDLIGMVKLPSKKWLTVRILPNDVLPVRRHWVNIIAGKDKREVKIPKLCVSFDPMSESDKKGVACPYCELAEGPEQFYLANVIVRPLQDDKPSRTKVSKTEQESGFKDRESESWTPVQVLRITSSLAKKIQGLKELNKVKSKKTGKTVAYDISDERFGCDISIKYDGDAKGPDKYQVQKGERAPLTEDESEYLIWELTEEILDEIGRETAKEAAAEVKRMQIVGHDELPEEDDEEDMSLGRKKGKKAAPKKSRSSDEDDDEDSDDDDEDDEPPRRSKKAPAKKSTRRSSKDEDEDSDDDGDDDDEDDDEDDEPPRRSKKAPAKKSTRRSSKDEDEDEEGDSEDDEEDDDDEPPRKRKPVAKKSPAKKSTRRSSKDEDEDDDDDDEDDDEGDSDDDEDDEPPRRSKKAPAKKRRSSKDDDDDDDIPF